MTSSVDPDQTASLRSSLIWVCTVLGLHLNVSCRADPLYRTKTVLDPWLALVEPRIKQDTPSRTHHSVLPITND